MKARIIVRPRQGVLDPQGKAIVHSLGELGYENIKDVRAGKCFDVEIEAKDDAHGREVLDEISRKLLANLVIEDYDVEVEG